MLGNYYLPGDLEAKIDAFVDHYNHSRYHESLSNLIPADVYFGDEDQAIRLDFHSRKAVPEKGRAKKGPSFVNFRLVAAQELSDLRDDAAGAEPV